MSLSKSPKQYMGVRANLPPDLITSTRAPTSSDTAYVKGTLWLDTVLSASYMWPGTGGWIYLGGAAGALGSLTGDSGGAIVPVAGNIDTLGTASQITTTGTAGTMTFSLPAAIIAPGSFVATTSIESTTTILCGTGLTVTTGGILVSGGDIINSHSDAGTDVTIEVTNSDNTNVASRSGVEIAVGGSSGGDPYLRFEISGVGASTMTMGLDNASSDLFVISNSTAIGTGNALTLTQAGALTATTSITATTALTATLGAITATNGNVVLGTSGNKIMSTSVGSSATAVANSFGKVTLVAGTITVTTTAIATGSIVMLTRHTVGATGAAALGQLSIGTISDGVSFIINAWKTADATDLATTDVSNISWMIIN